MVLAIICIFIYLAIAVISIFVWQKGLEEKNIVMTVIGAFLVLNIVGLVIAVLQCNVWNKPMITINNNK